MTATANPVEQSPTPSEPGEPTPGAPTSPLAATFARFFATKTGADVEGTMTYFSPDLQSYIDATLGWDFDSYDALKGAFAQYMPGWHPPARSYATRILSNETSALIHMVDTPELFGGELRILAAVDLVDGKIVRWVDYWDGAPFDGARYAQFRTPSEQFPTDLKDGTVATSATPELVAVTRSLHRALAAGDAGAVAALLHTDVAFHDLALRCHVVGRIETRRYLERVLGDVPYGAGSRLRHVVGGRHGGGVEWTAADGLVGITAVELDDDGLVTDIRSVYDSRQLAAAHRSALVSAAVAP